MGNSSNKKELNVAIEKIILKTLATFPKNDLENPYLIAAKIYFDQLLQIVLSDKAKDGERNHLKNMQIAFKDLEAFANYVFENKDRQEFYRKNDNKLKDTLNNLIKMLRSNNYRIEVGGKSVESIEPLVSEIDVFLFFIKCPLKFRDKFILSYHFF